MHFTGHPVGPGLLICKFTPLIWCCSLMLQNEKSGAMEAEAAKEENEAKEGIAGPTENSAAQSPVGGCCSEAIAELKESFHGLLYVVLLSAQPPADLPIVNP